MSDHFARFGSKLVAIQRQLPNPGDHEMARSTHVRETNDSRAVEVFSSIGGKRDKLVSAREAVALIKDGDTIGTGGFVGAGVPEELLMALEARFLETGQPQRPCRWFTRPDRATGRSAA
jgi:acyl-CoA hydrolase